MATLLLQKDVKELCIVKDKLKESTLLPMYYSNYHQATKYYFIFPQFSKWKIKITVDNDNIDDDDDDDDEITFSTVKVVKKILLYDRKL